MTPNDKKGRPSSSANAGRKSGRPAPPQPRRSARQERLTVRQNRRDLKATGNGSSARTKGILLWTGVAVVVAVFVIAAAILLTQPKSIGNFTSPTVVTPSNLPSTGQTLGPAGAPVTLDLYSDFRCTGCGAFYRTAEPQLVSNFVTAGKLKIVYYDFLTIDGLDASQGIQTTASRDAANAGLCAADEGKFWVYHDWLFANQSPTEDPAAFTIDRLIGIAKAAGIDNSGFESCVQQGTHNAEVAKEQSSAPSGIDATPTIYINGKVVTSAAGAGYEPTYAEIAAAINAATPLAATPSPQASAVPSPS
jgi:protein-disulfide isomerase